VDNALKTYEQLLSNDEDQLYLTQDKEALVKAYSIIEHVMQLLKDKHKVK